MSPEAQRIAIAEVCEWKRSDLVEGHWMPPGKGGTVHVFESNLPDYLNDLNAMHEAEKTLPWKKLAGMELELKSILREALAVDWRFPFHTTAAQRAEAFLRTLNLWNDYL